MKAIYIDILNKLRNYYPDGVVFDTFKGSISNYGDKELRMEAFHLYGLGLVDLKFWFEVKGVDKKIDEIKLTAKGRDILEEDGGLTAELSVVTVKLHAQTIKDLINAHIESSEADVSQKERMKEAIKNMPAQALQDVVTQLVQKGLDNGPTFLSWLQKLVN